MLITLLYLIALLSVFSIIFCKLTMGWDRSPTCLLGKTAVVTGSNTGIGFYTALDFAKRGGRVVLACRDMVKAEEAKQKIIQLTGNSNVIVKQINLASFSSVRAFAKNFNETEDRLDILVNNAGALAFGDTKSEDGHNLLMQVNYYGSFLLTHLLIDKLKKSARSRIVNVSSAMRRVAKLDADNLDFYPKGLFSEVFNYSNTKLCNICFTVELARRLNGTGVTTNALHPGVITTDIWRDAPFLLGIILKLFSLSLKDSFEGAQTTIYLSTSPDLKDVTGKYFADCREIKLSKKVMQRDFLKKIWDNTERIVNLKQEERIHEI